MRRTVTRAILLAALGALLLAAAACGGDDDESAASTEPAAAATTSGGGEETTSDDEAETSEESSDTPDFAATGECRELVELGTKVSQALGGTGGPELENTQEFLDEFADEAPEEIRDDFQVIAEAYAKIAEALGDVDVSAGAQPDPEAIAKLQQLSQELDQAELEEANRNITEWVEENCGTVTTD
jgi:hypothetical protein